MLKDLVFAPLDSDSDAPANIDERTLVGLVERLSQRFPHLHQMEILTAVVDSLTETQDAKVQSFRAILAERAARRRLVAAGAFEVRPSLAPIED